MSGSLRNLLPMHYQVGQRLWVRGPGDKRYEIELADYVPATPRWWSLWAIRFIDPVAAKAFHDRDCRAMADDDFPHFKMSPKGSPAPYRTVYEGALANALTVPA